MANRALNRDLRALRKDLDELQDRLEDLGEHSGDAAKHALRDLKGRLEDKLQAVFNSDTAEDLSDRGRRVLNRAEEEGKNLLHRAEKRGKQAFYDAKDSSLAKPTAITGASVAVFGLGFLVGWLAARR